MISRAVGDQVGFGERLADILSLREQESVGHGATNDQRIHFVEQIAEQIEFGRNFGAADNRRQRTLRDVSSALGQGLQARPAWCVRRKRAACDRGPRWRRGHGVRPKKRRSPRCRPASPMRRQMPGSFFSSPGWKRVFSRQRISPGFIAATARSAISPMQSSANLRAA